MQYFHMDGRAVWNFAIEAFPQAVHGALARVGKTIEDVDFVIPHQANINIIKTGMEKLGLPMSKTFTNLHKYGNTARCRVCLSLCAKRWMMDSSKKVIWWSPPHSVAVLLGAQTSFSFEENLEIQFCERIAKIDAISIAPKLCESSLAVGSGLSPMRKAFPFEIV